LFENLSFLEEWVGGQAGGGRRGTEYIGSGEGKGRETVKESDGKGEGKKLKGDVCSLCSMAKNEPSKNAGSVRIRRERETIEAMIGIYCRGNHGAGGELCDECTQLKEYANKRLDLCPHGEEKPTCLKCPIHCYRAEEREQVRTVMRYAGPRMLLYHPIIAIRHILDGKKK